MQILSTLLRAYKWLRAKIIQVPLSNLHRELAPQTLENTWNAYVNHSAIFFLHNA